jgi:uncharacterized membrane protein YhaH (DUF805 family)
LADRNQLFWLFFSLNGRVSPGAYVLAGLLLLIVRMFLVYRIALVAEDSSAAEGWTLVFVVAVLLTAWSTIALTAKRFHDFGRPAGWALIALVADLLVFFVLPFVKGDAGPNRYGTRTNAPG